MTDFRLCSTCLSRSLKQAYAIVLYWRFPTVMSLPYAHLCYSLGGDRPSQTTRLALSYAKIGLLQWRCYLATGWCFIDSLRWACVQTVIAYHLPYTIDQSTSIQGCSKGARGLSVLPQVPRIFTRISISLSLCWRQRGSRYTIHAGRNLPDKEFRYLWTVIVTAAVYWNFNQMLSTSRLRWSALGRCQTLYFILRFCRVLCFW